MEQKQLTVVRLVIVFLLVPDNTVKRPPLKPASRWFHTHIIPATQSWSETQLSLQISSASPEPSVHWMSMLALSDCGQRHNVSHQPANNEVPEQLKHPDLPSPRGWLSHTCLSSLDCFLSSHMDETTERVRVSVIKQACCYLPSVGLNRFKFQQSTRWHETQTVFLQKCMYVT